LFESFNQVVTVQRFYIFLMFQYSQ